jgi:hypothetical protein
MIKKITQYYRSSLEQKNQQAKLMRQIACTKYDLQGNLTKIRAVIEDIGASR